MASYLQIRNDKSQYAHHIHPGCTVLTVIKKKREREIANEVERWKVKGEEEGRGRG